MPLPRLLGPVIAFSRFWFARDAGLLISDGNVIELAARPFAVLDALLAARGRIVSGAELRELVWHGANVEANAVQAQVSAIRRALGADRDILVTMPGQGYRIACDIRLVDSPNLGADADEGFLSPPSAPSPIAGTQRPTQQRRFVPFRNDTQAVQRTSPSGNAPASPALSAPPHRRPLPASPFIGRHAELSELLAIVPARRIVTLTGAPGIGKTRLALEAATRLASQFPDGTFCVELAPLTQPERITDAIFAATGLREDFGATVPAMLGFEEGDRRMLAIVDHCDHLSEAASRALDALIANTRGLHVIVTCGSPLFIGGEVPMAVAPLRVPAEAGHGLAASAFDDALHLLYARLSQWLDAAGYPRRVLDKLASEPSAQCAAATICRRTAGVPLALELAAASIASSVGAGSSVEDAVVRCAGTLDTHFIRRTGARRIALPHAMIAHNAIDRFDSLLDEPTRATLRRLSVFAGKFSFEAALELLGAFNPSGVVHHSAHRQANARRLQTLVAAGLLDESECDGVPCLHLPHAVRRHALSEVDRRDESDAAAMHHAHYVAQNIKRSALAPTRHEIDDLRAALEWSIASDKIELCADLLDHCAAPWAALSLLDEYIAWIRAALEKATSAAVPRVRNEMRLHAAMATALTLRSGAPDEIEANWKQAYKLATVCADSLQRLRALLSLIMNALDACHLEQCEELCATFGAIAASAQLPAAEVNARRLEGIVKAYCGEFQQAIALLEPVTERGGPDYEWATDTDRAGDARAYDPETLLEADTMATTFGVSLHLVAEATLAAALWFTGAEQPCRYLHGLLRARRDDHDPLALCIALEQASALAMQDDDIARVESYATALVTHARLSRLNRWLRAGLNVQLWLEARRGASDATLSLLAGAAKRMGRGRTNLLDLTLVATLLPIAPLEHDSDLAGALSAAIRMAVKHGEACGEHWSIPELLRVDAVLRAAMGDPANVVADVRELALDRAQRHGAKRIELRILADRQPSGVPHAADELRVDGAPFARCPGNVTGDA